MTQKKIMWVLDVMHFSEVSHNVPQRSTQSFEPSQVTSFQMRWIDRAICGVNQALSLLRTPPRRRRGWLFGVLVVAQRQLFAGLTGKKGGQWVVRVGACLELGLPRAHHMYNTS